MSDITTLSDESHKKILAVQVTTFAEREKVIEFGPFLRLSCF